MRFLFFILLLASFTASANPDSSQFAAMAQELDYILTKIEEREQMGAQETTYVYMRGTYNTQLASTAKNKTPISEQAIKEADSYLYQLDTMGRKTIMFYTYMFYSEKENNRYDYKTTIEKTFDDLFSKRDGTGKVNVLINIMIYNQKLTDRADQYSFNLYQDNMRQSYSLEDGLEKAVHAELSKEIKNKTANTMSKNCNKALVFRAKLLLEKVKVWKKSKELISKSFMKNVYSRSDRIDSITYYINLYRNEFGINNCTKMIHFLAQAAHESGGFTDFLENGVFTRERETYKGRGIFQLTFKDNYLNFQNFCIGRGENVDFISNPSLIETPKYAVMSALWYWANTPRSTKNMNYYAKDLNNSTLVLLSKIVNCGNTQTCGFEKDDDGEFKRDDDGNKIRCSSCSPNGLEDRMEKFIQLKQLIPCTN